MKERPILFSAPMVRALLDGRKTQTRRVVKRLPPGVEAIEPHQTFSCEWSPWKDGERLHSLTCPYGDPGDLLWVRETWQSDVAFAYTKPSVIPPGERFFYRAGGSQGTTGLSVCATGWRPGIHMPRWASRITLRITDVRVERLQEISVVDCYAEGCFRPDPARSLGSEVTIRDNARGEYRRIWEAINGPGSWDANPWVWAITFKRAEDTSDRPGQVPGRDQA